MHRKQETPKDGNVYVKLCQLGKAEFAWTVERWNKHIEEYVITAVESKEAGIIFARQAAAVLNVQLLLLPVAGASEPTSV